MALILLGTPWAIILPALNSSFAVFFCHQTFQGYPSELSDTARQDGVDATLDVANTGERDGEMALLSRVERPVKEPRAFARVAVRAGEKRTVTLSVPVSRLAYFCETENDFVLKPLEYEFTAAQHSADTTAPSAHIRLGQPS